MKKLSVIIITVLGILLFTGCPKDKNDVKPSEEATFDLYTSPSDPQLFVAHHPDGTTVTYLGEKDRDGNVLSIDAYTVLFPGEQEPWYYELDEEGLPVTAFANNGVTFQFEWLSPGNLIVTAISPTGAVEVRTPVDFTGGKSAEISENLYKTYPNIREGKESEIIVKPIQSDNLSIPARDINKLRAYVEKCGKPCNDAMVTFKITPWDGGVLVAPRIEGFDGFYEINGPIQNEEPIDWSSYCQSIVNKLDFTCNFVKDIDATAGCTMLGAAIDMLLGGPTGEAVPIIAACQSAWSGMQLYCKTLGESAADKSIASYLCDEILKKIQNPPQATTYIVRAIASIPGEGTFDGGEMNWTPGTFLEFGIAVSPEKKIKNFKTTPFDPAPEEDYIASAEILCPEEDGTEVTISIVGTDGYTDSKTITLYENGEISLWVPGAEQGVNDKITITMENGPTKVIGIVF